MRDYKGSGSFSLRKRRRFPRGLTLVILLIIAVAIAGLLFVDRIPILGASTGDTSTSPAAAKPASGRDVIPLKIPQQSSEQSPAAGG